MTTWTAFRALTASGGRAWNVLRALALLLTVAIPGMALDSVSVFATSPTAVELGQQPGVYTFTRTGSTGTLAVVFTLTGTADVETPAYSPQAGVDYVTPTSATVSSTTNTVPVISVSGGLSFTFSAGVTSVDVPLKPLPNGLIYGQQAVVATLVYTPTDYIIGGSPAATVTIAEADWQATTVVPIPLGYKNINRIGIQNDPDVNRRAASRLTFSPAQASSTIITNLTTSGATAFGSPDSYFSISGGSLANVQLDDQVEVTGSGPNNGLITYVTGVGTNTVFVASNFAVGNSVSVQDSLLTENLKITHQVITDNVAFDISPFLGKPSLTNSFLLNWKVGGSNLIQTPSIARTGPVQTGTIGQGMGFYINNPNAYNIGDNDLLVTNGTGPLSVGDKLQFLPDVTLYTITFTNPSSIVGVSGNGKGEIYISPPLKVAVANNQVVTNTTNAASQNYQIAQTSAYQAGRRLNLRVAPASDPRNDGIFRGDVISFATQGAGAFSGQGTTLPGFYVVTKGFETMPGYIDIQPFLNTGSVTDGLAAPIADHTSIITLTSLGEINPQKSTDSTFQTAGVQLPSFSSHIELSVDPVEDFKPTGAQSINIAALANPDYTLINPTVGQVTIADDNVTANITLGQNASKPGSAGFFTVTFSQPFTRDITVPYVVLTVGAPNTNATPGVDYTPLSGSIVVPAGATSAQIPVSPLPTATFNPNGVQVEVQLLSSLDYVLAGTGSSQTNPTAVVNIADSEGTVGVIASSAQAYKSPQNPGTTSFTITLNRNPGETDAVSVNYAVGGTAKPGIDYVALPGNVTIPAGGTSATITITPIDSQVAVGTTTVALTIQPGQGYAITSNITDNTQPEPTATITILDDVPVVSIAPGAAAALPLTHGSFVVSYAPNPGGALNRSVAVPYTLTGSASLSRYSATSEGVNGTGVIVIPANQTQTIIDITPIEDQLFHNTDTITVTLGTGSAFVLGASNSATINLFSDAPTISITAVPPNNTATESAITPIAGNFTISYPGIPAGTALGFEVDVPYTISGSATAGVSYQALSGLAKIPAGSLSTTIPVIPIDDQRVDPTLTVTVGLQTPNPAFYALNPLASQASINIINTDVGVSSVTTTNANGTYGLGSTITLDVNFNDVVTVTGTPHLLLATGTIPVGFATYTSGSGTSTLVFTYVVRAGDLNADLDYVDSASLKTNGGTIVNSLGAAALLTLPNPGATGSLSNLSTIAINGGPAFTGLVSVTASPIQAQKDPTNPTDSFFTVSIDRSSTGLTGAITVNYAVNVPPHGTLPFATSNQDFEALPGTVTIPANQNSAQVLVIPVDSQIPVGPTSVVLTIEPGQGYTPATLSPLPFAIVNILDDMPAPITATGAALDSVSVFATTSTAYEQGPVPGVFTFTRTGSIGSLVVNFTTAGITNLNGYTPQPGVDYQPLPPVIGGGTVGASATAALVVGGNSGAIASLGLVAGGSGYTAAPNVVFAGGGGSGAAATATINGSGNVVGLTLTAAGINYSTPPTVLLLPTSVATATATVVGGSVSSLAVVNPGSGYSATPLVTFIGGGGTGASAVATIDNTGKVTGMVITSGGTGYTSVPTVLLVNQSSQVLFTPGVTAVAVPLVPIPNGRIAGKGQVSARIFFDPINYIVGNSSAAVVTIAEKDLLARLSIPTPLASKSVDLFGTVLDPFAQRRGLARVSFNPINAGITRNASLDVSGSAQPGVGYNLQYKIGGTNGGVPTGVAGQGLGFAIDQPNAYQVGAQVINLVNNTAGTLAGIAKGETIRFGTDQVHSYKAFNALIGGGPLTLTTPIVAPIPNNATVSVTNAADTAPAGDGAGFTVSQDFAYPAGTTTNMIVDGGIGGLYRGDVIRFQLPDKSFLDGFYVITQGFEAGSTSSSAGTINIRPFLDTAGSGGGLATGIPDKTSIVTVFDLSVNNQQTGGIVIGPESSHIDYMVNPIEDGAPTGAQSVLFTLLADPDYTLQNPTVGTVTIADDNVTTNVTLGQNASKPANAGFFTITFNRPFTRDITVPYQVLASSTAVPGVDYIPLPGSITIPAGQVSVTVPVTPLPTSSVNPGGVNVQIALLNSPDYVLAGSGSSQTNPSATVNISDSIGTISVTAPAAPAFKDQSTPGTQSFTFSIVRTPNRLDAVSVNYTISGSAHAGVDYVPLTGTVTIPSGQSTATVLVTPIETQVAVGTTTVSVSIQSGQGYAIDTTNASASISILDDVPVITIAPVQDAQLPGTHGRFQVSYARAAGVPALSRAVSIPYTLSGSAATSRYTVNGSANLVTIPANALSTFIDITPIDDQLFHTTDTITITLGTGSNFVLSPAASATINLVDNAATVSIVAVQNPVEPTTAGSFLVGYPGIPAGTALTYPLTVSYAVSGTATAGTSYAILSGSVVIPANQLSASIPVVPIEDHTVDPGLTVTATLNPASSYAVNSASSAATVTIIDSDAAVASVTSTSPDGVYTINRTISIQVTFIKPVTVTGTPVLVLNTGTVSELATYVSGSGTTTLNFTYQVKTGDISGALDYLATNALSGTITNAFGVPVLLTLPAPGTAGSLSYGRAIVIDGASAGDKPIAGTAGTVTNSSNGNCGLGSFFAVLALGATMLRRRRR